MIWEIAGYLTKNRSENGQKIAQSTHENGYIKPRKTFWRNSKQLLNWKGLNNACIFRKEMYIKEPKGKADGCFRLRFLIDSRLFASLLSLDILIKETLDALFRRLFKLFGVEADTGDLRIGGKLFVQFAAVHFHHLL